MRDDRSRLPDMLAAARDARAFVEPPAVAECARSRSRPPRAAGRNRPAPRRPGLTSRRFRRMAV